jgi:hypothetical protein
MTVAGIHELRQKKMNADFADLYGVILWSGLRRCQGGPLRMEINGEGLKRGEIRDF